MLSVLFSWMYGIVGVCLGVFSFYKIIQFKRLKTPSGKTAIKLQWAKILSICGSILSLLFLIYYIMVLCYGTFIHFF